VVVCLEQSANDLYMVQLMPLSPTISCSIKIQNGSDSLMLAYPGCPEKEAVKWVFVFNTVSNYLWIHSNNSMVPAHNIQSNHSQSQIIIQ